VYSLLNMFAEMLRAPETLPAIKLSLLKAWAFAFRAEDHKFLRRIGILPDLYQSFSEVLAQPSPTTDNKLSTDSLTAGV